MPCKQGTLPSFRIPFSAEFDRISFMQHNTVDTAGPQPHVTTVQAVALSNGSLWKRVMHVQLFCKMNGQRMSDHIISIFCVSLGKYVGSYFQSFKVHNLNIILII